MTVPRKAVVVSITLFVLAGLALIFFSAGGFEKYEEPIQIIVPRSVNGVLCFKLVPLMVGDKLSAQSKLLISDDGYLSISSGLIQSHRKKQFFRLSDSAPGLVPIEDDGWMPIRTESDLKNGVSYTVYWLGTREGWRKLSEQQGEKPFCANK